MAPEDVLSEAQGSIPKSLTTPTRQRHMFFGNTRHQAIAHTRSLRVTQARVLNPDSVPGPSFGRTLTLGSVGAESENPPRAPGRDAARSAAYRMI